MPPILNIPTIKQQAIQLIKPFNHKTFQPFFLKSTMVFDMAVIFDVLALVG